MSRAHNKKANPEKYAGKAYLSYDESTDFLGISLSTLNRYIADEKIETHKFHRDKKRYLAMGDVKQIEDLIKNPWKRTAPSAEKPQDNPLQGERQEIVFTPVKDLDLELGGIEESSTDDKPAA